MTETADVLLAATESAILEQSFALFDEEFTRIGSKFRCTYHKSAGRGWPGRRLRRRVGFRVYEIKRLLNPNYLQDRDVHYELRDQWMYDFGEIFTKLLSHRVLATLTSAEVADVVTISHLVRTALTAAVP